MLAQAERSIDPLSSTEERSLNQPRVLLADDRVMVLERVRSLLQANFQVVGTANNGEDLVSEAMRLRPDVIVLDITMPILTGIEAAHKLREAQSCSKIIFLTVHAEPEFMDACFAEGALGYVTKWRLRTDLVPAINEALFGRRFISPSFSRH